MKALSISDYLDHLGRAPAENGPPRRENSPFRPRTLPRPASAESGPAAAFARAARADGAGDREREETPRRTPWDRRPAVQSAAQQLPPRREAAKAEDIAVRLAEAHTRGREEGLAEGRAEAQDRHAAELVAARREAQTLHEESERSAYAGLEGAIRSGFGQIEDNVGAAVTRILTPFLAGQVVQHIADELAKAIARLCAGGSPGLMTIRGPERVLALLRERIADVPAEIDYVDDKGPEVVVEANVTQIVTELRSWAGLLASLEA